MINFAKELLDYQHIEAMLMQEVKEAAKIWIELHSRPGNINPHEYKWINLDDMDVLYRDWIAYTTCACTSCENYEEHVEIRGNVKLYEYENDENSIFLPASFVFDMYCRKAFIKYHESILAGNLAKEQAERQRYKERQERIKLFDKSDYDIYLELKARFEKEQ